MAKQCQRDGETVTETGRTVTETRFWGHVGIVPRTQQNDAGDMIAGETAPKEHDILVDL